MRLSREFHVRKLGQVRDHLVRQGLDAIVLLNPLNIYYTTGFWYRVGTMERPIAVVISQEKPPQLFVSLDLYGHRNPPISEVVSDVRVYSEYPYTSEGWPTFKWLCRQINDGGFRGKRIGVEDNFMPINDGLCTPWFDQCAEYLDAQVTRAGWVVSELRMKHEPEEIALLRKACHYADLMVRTVSEQLMEGLTEHEVASAAAQVVEGQMRHDLPDIVPSLVGRDALVYGGPYVFHQTMGPGQKSHIVENVPIIVNCVAVVGGYHGESERCGVLGNPSAKQQELFEIAMECQLRAKDAVRPGVTGHEVDRIAKDIVEGAGHKYLYGVGHGLGLLGHEPPWIREHSQTVLEPGMVITIEPGLGTREWGSFHCSDTVLVTETGCESLTVYDGIHRIDLP